MSLASSSDCISRPEDKAAKLFFPSPEYTATNCFDEFFNPDLYNDSDEDQLKVQAEESVDPLDLDSCSTAHDRGTDYALLSQAEHSPPQPWRKGLWCLSQKSDAPQLVVEKTRKTNYAHPQNVSPSHLIANTNSASRPSRSLTQPVQTKSPSPHRLQQSHCTPSPARQRPGREMTMSPSVMYSSTFEDERHLHVDSWQTDFQNINLQLNDDRFAVHPLSPSPLINYSYLSYSQPRRANNPNQAGRMDQARPATLHNTNHGVERQDCYHDASSLELAAVLTANMAATSRNMFSEPPDSEDLTYKIVNDDCSPMLEWMSQSPSSSNNSHHSNQSQFTTTARGQHQSELYRAAPPTEWWPPPTMLSTQDRISQETYTELAQPKPRRVTHNVLTHGELTGGLGIQYPSAEEIGVALPYHPPELQPLAGRQSQRRNDRASTVHTNALGSYPALPPPIPGFNEGSPFTTPHRGGGRRSSSTPSPPVPPTHRTPRSYRARSPSRRDASQHRRKSIHKSGPVKESSVDAGRHRSTSRPPRTPKTPRTPGEGFALDFVNFTPRDAVKLLNDVAPSGSSKTRARREQEARDRRKKFSEAALDAVRQAGGDIELVEKAMLS